MIHSFAITNYLGDRIKLDLREPEVSGFLIKSVTGLGPVKATVNTTEVVTNDGSMFNSARLSQRNIVFQIVFVDTVYGETIEDVRQKSYKYFPAKKNVEIIIETDNRYVRTNGYVESNEPNIFSSQEGTSISIICPDPFFYSAGEDGNNVTDFYSIDPLFEFPFSNESLTEPLLVFGEIQIKTEGVITYYGDAEIGVTIYIHAIGPANNITIEELLVQHCIVNAMKPMFCKGMYEHSYASLPGRGAHKGKQVIEKWIRTDSKNCKYVLKMDIRHFFDSIPHDRLKAKLKKTVHDEKMLELLFRIIDVTEVGIPLGFYTSQWLSNWYLQGLDHFIKEQLCAVHYMRYMDDMVVFGSNKRVLHRMRQAISDYLEMELGLELKANWRVFRFSYGNNQGRDLDFMGFRFYRNRTILRKSIMYKATRKARKISKKEKATILDARQMLSYLGWIDCTDTYLMYRKWIKPCVSFQQLKRKVSRYDKYDEKRVYQKLVSLYTAKGGKSHGVKLQICREHSPTDCT